MLELDVDSLFQPIPVVEERSTTAACGVTDEVDSAIRENNQIPTLYGPRSYNETTKQPYLLKALLDHLTPLHPRFLGDKTNAAVLLRMYHTVAAIRSKVEKNSNKFVLLLLLEPFQ